MGKLQEVEGGLLEYWTRYTRKYQHKVAQMAASLPVNKTTRGFTTEHSFGSTPFK
jgi:hypothetical protein